MLGMQVSAHREFEDEQVVVLFQILAGGSPLSCNTRRLLFPLFFTSMRGHRPACEK